MQRCFVKLQKAGGLWFISSHHYITAGASSSQLTRALCLLGSNFSLRFSGLSCCVTQQTGIEDTEPLWMGAEPGSPVVVYRRTQRSYHMLLEVLRTASENSDAMGRPQTIQTPVLSHSNTRSMKTAVVVCLVQWNIVSEAIVLSKYLFTVERETIFPLTNRHFSTWPHPPSTSLEPFFQISIFSQVHYTPSVPWQSKFIMVLLNTILT